MSTSILERHPIRGVYAITDGPRDDLVDVVAAALRGGVRVVQYRDKTGDATRRLDEASALNLLCRRHGVPLIVNDDVELALAIGASGVHLGEDDAEFDAARSQLGPGVIIGVSCYDDIDRAAAFAQRGADYLAFGAFFPSRSKSTTRRATPRLLHDARAFGKPLVAIGGIDAGNARPLIDAGADAIAVISAIFAADDIEAAARQMAALFEPGN